MLLPRSALLLAALVLLAGCAAPPEEPPAEPAGRVVVGITSDFVPVADIGRLDAVISIDGAEETAPRSWSIQDNDPLAFPMELPLDELTDGARVDVLLSAFEAAESEAPPFMTRRAATKAVGGKDMLLRTHLEWECVPSFNLGGEALAPTCHDPDTCVAAECVDPYVPPGELEPYSPSWAVAFADECCPLDAGEPVVVVGQGIEDFSPLVPDGDIPMELGSQGGYHIWLALRMKNLHRAGSETTITVTRTSTEEELCAMTLPWDFSPTGGGDCDLTGIRCVVSYDIQGLKLLVNEQVRVDAKVVDSTGAVGFGKQVGTLAVPE